MRLIVIASLLFGFITVSSPSLAANCGGLPVDGGVIPAGTYTLTDNCYITDMLVVESFDTVTINGNGYALDGSNTYSILEVEEDAILNLNNVIVRNGYIDDYGGGIFGYPYSTINITGSTITNNHSTDDGGGIFVAPESVLTITSSVISGNISDDDGGGIATEVDVVLTIIGSTISGNISGDDGGGVSIDFGTIATIRNSSIIGNSAADGGGGVSADELSELTIINSTIANNSAYDGGGINVEDESYAIVIHSTIVNNGATMGDGIFVEDTGTSLSLVNSIVSGNGAANCLTQDGALLDNGGNMENGNSCGFADYPNTDPMLSGLTNGFMFPYQGSPAIDAAPDCAGLTNDQIGTSRPNGAGCDIGAIEWTDSFYIPAPPMCNTISDVSAYGLPDGVYCRVLMRNGAWMTDAGTVPGNLVQANPILAVDVFRITGQSVTSDDFGGYVQICLPGTGRLIFLDARTSPRAEVEITPVEFINGSTCGWIPNAGTLVLIPR